MRHGDRWVSALGVRSTRNSSQSPILASTPDADIIEVGERGFQRSKWEDLALVDHWRRYMATPEAYLRYVTEE